MHTLQFMLATDASHAARLLTYQLSAFYSRMRLRDPRAQHAMDTHILYTHVSGDPSRPGGIMLVSCE